MQTWKGFELDVISLLKLQGWSIKPEHIIRHKKVDCYGEKVGNFGRTERIAVECKQYKSTVTQEQVSQIYANYLPLIQADDIDQILLVTQNDISPSARTFCETAKGMLHSTYLELLNSLMDFSGYTKGMISQYYQDELDKYYVSQGYSTDGPGGGEPSLALEKELLRWVASTDNRPIAILAGYGMGKTTLARRMSFILAKEHRKRPEARIPILIKLEDIASEQSLEGLIGKQFTSTSIIGNYNFNVFMELNQRGRFVIILDGFDEMKQMMSWEAMRYNFLQLNRLVAGRAKVIIGGRPSAFLNEEEYIEALHGRRLVLGEFRRMLDWPDYREFHLLPFSEDQIREFIVAYADVLSQRQRSALDEPKVAKLVADLESQKNGYLFGLASRPVQLRMILEILPTWGEDVDALTLTALYSEFVDLIIRRESAKRSRQRFSLTERREFAMDLAFYMWNEGLGSTISYAKVPARLFEERGANDDNMHEIARDLLSACFLEVKQPGGYYFPHRSFQEYLVAEKLASLMKAKRFPLEETFSVNQEIVEFLYGLMGRADVLRLRDAVWSFRGTVQDWVLDLLLRVIDQPNWLVDDLGKNPSPWIITALYKGIVANRWELGPLEKDLIMGDSFLRPPDGCTEKVEWTTLLVVISILLKSRYQDLGLNFEARLHDLMNRAQTLSAFYDIRASAIDLILFHSQSSYCHLPSWSASRLPKSMASDVYNFKKLEPQSSDRGDGTTIAGKPKSPHKLSGVTKKKEYRKRRAH